MKILWIDLNSSYAHSSLALPALHAQIADDTSIEWASGLSCNSWGINLCNFPSMHTPLLIYTGRTSYLPLHEMKP